MTEEKKFVGYIVGGGLKESLNVRLAIPAQEVQEGAFVVTESGEWLFYGLVTDLQLGATDPRFADERSGDLGANERLRRRVDGRLRCTILRHSFLTTGRVIVTRHWFLLAKKTGLFTTGLLAP